MFPGVWHGNPSLSLPVIQFSPLRFPLTLVRTRWPCWLPSLSSLQRLSISFDSRGGHLGGPGVRTECSCYISRNTTRLRVQLPSAGFLSLRWWTRSICHSCYSCPSKLWSLEPSTTLELHPTPGHVRMSWDDSLKCHLPSARQG